MKPFHPTMVLLVLLSLDAATGFTAHSRDLPTTFPSQLRPKPFLTIGRRGTNRMSGTINDSTIVSPFDDSESPSAATVTTTTTDEYLELTWDNVEAVLNEMRPYLIQDGGNVVISEIDGPVVKLQLQVRRYGSCWCRMKGRKRLFMNRLIGVYLLFCRIHLH